MQIPIEWSKENWNKAHLCRWTQTWASVLQEKICHWPYWWPSSSPHPATQLLIPALNQCPCLLSLSLQSTSSYYKVNTYLKGTTVVDIISLWELSVWSRVQRTKYLDARVHSCNCDICSITDVLEIAHCHLQMRKEMWAHDTMRDGMEHRSLKTTRLIVHNVGYT